MLKVAIIGKPNVGKSTLFNRLSQKRKAITDKTIGITRDRNGIVVDWLNRHFFLLDTGGLVLKADNNLQNCINEQTLIAIKEADIIIFLIANKDGINEDDLYIAKILKKIKGKKVIFALNKIESATLGDCHRKVIYGLGFGEPILISSEHGIGIGNLLNKIIEDKRTNQTNPISELPITKFCVIGRPNVGKSTIVNALIKQNRVIVTPEAGTTRDAIDVQLKFDNNEFIVIDTAGIRKKGKIGHGVESYAVNRALTSIRRSDFICFVIDASQDFTEQDEIVGGLAWKANIPTIILANKIDLVDKSTENLRQINTIIRQKFHFLSHSPIVLISGLKKQNLEKIFKTIKLIQNEQKIKISPSILNEVIQKAQTNNSPPIFKGGRIRINYATQIKSQITSFVLLCNNPNFLHFSYSRYIENQIRDAFNIKHIPIMLYFKAKEARKRKKQLNEDSIVHD